MRRYLLVLLAFIFCINSVDAREVYILNNSWRFFFKDENSSDEARFIHLPHTWNTANLGETTSLHQTTANYRRTLFVPQQWQGKRLFLSFGGVMNVADVFVNGSHVGSHKGGYTAFTVEITERVNFGAENTLLVEVSNAYRSDILPTSTDQNLYGGIYRDVELIVTEKNTISPLYYGTQGVIVHQTKATPDIVEGSINVALTGKTDALCNVTVDILSPDGYMAATKSVKAKISNKLINIPFTINNPELWSPQQPSLYNIEVIVGADTVRTTTGFRTIAINENKLLTVNGKRIPIRGVSLSHDKAGRGNALQVSDYQTIFHHLCDVGANAMRSLTGPHAQNLYDMCDRNGTLVWIDIPFTQSPFLSDIAYYANADFENNGINCLTEIVLQNIHHPSVAMWGIFSLLRGRSTELLDYIKTLNTTAKKLDPSRYTVACSNQDGDINFITDLIVWQQSLGWDKGAIADLDIWQKALRENWHHLSQAICYGAGGTIGQQSDNKVSHTVSQHRVPESWQTIFHEGYIERIDEDLFWGIWVNNLFDHGSVRRMGGICNSGLASFDHNTFKDSYFLYKTLWNKEEPCLHIVGKNRQVRRKNNQVIKLYCSQGVPSLTINGDSVLVKNCGQGIFVTDSLMLNDFNTVIATTPELRDSTSFSIGNYLRRK